MQDNAFRDRRIFLAKSRTNRLAFYLGALAVAGLFGAWAAAQIGGCSCSPATSSARRRTS